MRAVDSLKKQTNLFLIALRSTKEKKIVQFLGESIAPICLQFYLTFRVTTYLKQLKQVRNKIYPKSYLEKRNSWQNLSRVDGILKSHWVEKKKKNLCSAEGKKIPKIPRLIMMLYSTLIKYETFFLAADSIHWEMMDRGIYL